MSKKDASLLDEAIDLVSSTASKVTDYAKANPWSVAVETAIASMSLPDIGELWHELEVALGMDVETVEDMIQIMQEDTNANALVLDIFSSRQPTADGLAKLLPPIYRSRTSEMAMKLADRWNDRKEVLDVESLIQSTDDPAELLLRYRTLDDISSFFGVHADEGLIRLHSSLRAFVNTSSSSLERTLAIRTGSKTSSNVR